MEKVIVPLATPRTSTRSLELKATASTKKLFEKYLPQGQGSRVFEDDDAEELFEEFLQNQRAISPEASLVDVSMPKYLSHYATLRKLQDSILSPKVVDFLDADDTECSLSRYQLAILGDPRLPMRLPLKHLSTRTTLRELRLIDELLEDSDLEQFPPNLTILRLNVGTKITQRGIRLLPRTLRELHLLVPVLDQSLVTAFPQKLTRLTLQVQDLPTPVFSLFPLTLEHFVAYLPPADLEGACATFRKRHGTCVAVIGGRRLPVADSRKRRAKAREEAGRGSGVVR